MMTVYLVTNTENGKQYVGQTVKPVLWRWGRHCGDAYRNRGCSVLGAAIRKYGPEAFEVKILREVETKEELDFYEKFYIKSLNTLCPNGYNLTEGGEGIHGWHPNEEQLEKLRKAKKGNKAMLGKHFSKEHRLKLAASKLGTHSSEETRKKLKDGWDATHGHLRGKGRMKHAVQEDSSISMAAAQ